MPPTAPVRVAACVLALAASLASGIALAPAAVAAEPGVLPEVSSAHDKRPDLVGNHGRKLG